MALLDDLTDWAQSKGLLGSPEEAKQNAENYLVDSGNATPEIQAKVDARRNPPTPPNPQLDALLQQIANRPNASINPTVTEGQSDTLQSLLSASKGDTEPPSETEEQPSRELASAPEEEGDEEETDQGGPAPQKTTGEETPSPTEPQEKPPSEYQKLVDMLGQQQKGFAAAQQAAAQNRLYAGLAAAASQMAAGPGQPNLQGAKMLEASADAPLQQFFMQHQMEKSAIDIHKDMLDLKNKEDANDPNSQSSKNFRDIFKAYLPEFATKMPNLDNMSRTDIEKAVPWGETRIKLDMLKLAKQQQYDRQVELKTLDKLGKFSDSLDPGKRGNTAMVKATENKQKAQRALSILNQYRRPDGTYNFTGAKDTDLQELQTAYTAMQTGGVPPASRTAALHYKTAFDQFSKGWDTYLQGNLPETNQIQALNWFASNVHHLSDLADKQILDQQLGNIHPETVLSAKSTPEHAEKFWNIASDRTGIPLRSMEDVKAAQKKLKSEMIGAEAPPQGSTKPGPGSIVNVKGTRYRVGADGNTLEPL